MICIRGFNIILIVFCCFIFLLIDSSLLFFVKLMSAYILNSKISSTFDLGIPQSTISHSFVHPIQPALSIGSVYTTLITVPTDRGPFSANIAFILVERAEPVVVLGTDWVSSFIRSISLQVSGMPGYVFVSFGLC